MALQKPSFKIKSAVGWPVAAETASNSYKVFYIKLTNDRKRAGFNPCHSGRVISSFMSNTGGCLIGG